MIIFGVSQKSLELLFGTKTPFDLKGIETYIARPQSGALIDTSWRKFIYRHRTIHKQASFCCLATGRLEFIVIAAWVWCIFLKNVFVKSSLEISQTLSSSKNLYAKKILRQMQTIIVAAALYDEGQQLPSLQAYSQQTDKYHEF